MISRVSRVCYRFSRSERLWMEVCKNLRIEVPKSESYFSTFQKWMEGVPREARCIRCFSSTDQIAFALILDDCVSIASVGPYGFKIVYTFGFTLPFINYKNEERLRRQQVSRYLKQVSVGKTIVEQIKRIFFPNEVRFKWGIVSWLAAVHQSSVHRISSANGNYEEPLDRVRKTRIHLAFLWRYGGFNNDGCASPNCNAYSPSHPWWRIWSIFDANSHPPWYPFKIQRSIHLLHPRSHLLHFHSCVSDVSISLDGLDQIWTSAPSMRKKLFKLKNFDPKTIDFEEPFLISEFEADWMKSLGNFEEISGEFGPVRVQASDGEICFQENLEKFLDYAKFQRDLRPKRATCPSERIFSKISLPENLPPGKDPRMTFANLQLENKFQLANKFQLEDKFQLEKVLLLNVRDLDGSFPQRLEAFMSYSREPKDGRYFQLEFQVERVRPGIRSSRRIPEI